MFFVRVLLRYNSHATQFISWKCTVQWVLIYSQGCADDHCNKFHNSFLAPRRHRGGGSRPYIFPQHPQAKAPLIYFLAIDLPILSNFKKDFVYLLLERGEGREKERERNISQVPLAHPHRNSGMCPDPESNWPPFGLRLVLDPLCHTCWGYSEHFI